MIDVKELQVGSLISDDFKSNLRVKEINGAFVTCEVSNENWKPFVDRTHPLVDLQPIPITAEWLEKLGFERMKNSLFRNYSYEGLNGHISLSVRTSNNPVYWISDVSFSIVSVHHLQQLVFALECVWLTITPAQP